MATKITIQADGSQASRELQKTGKAIGDLGTEVGTLKKGVDLLGKGWDLYAGSQKKMAAAVIELSRGFGKLSPTAKGFVETTDRLEKRSAPWKRASPTPTPH